MRLARRQIAAASVRHGDRVKDAVVGAPTAVASYAPSDNGVCTISQAATNLCAPNRRRAISRSIRFVADANAIAGASAARRNNGQLKLHRGARKTGPSRFAGLAVHCAVAHLLSSRAIGTADGSDDDADDHYGLSCVPPERWR